LKKVSAFVALLATWNLGPAQDLVITNARIIVGTGATINQGSVIVVDGRITSVVEGTVDARGTEINAEGMTVMPGFIDTHRHFLGGSRVTTEAEMRQWIEEELPGSLEKLLGAGVTTTLSASDAYPHILRARQLVESGEIRGPRILSSGYLFAAPGERRRCGSDWCQRHRELFEVEEPEIARARIRGLAEAGVDAIKVFFNPAGPLPVLSDPVLAAISEEAERHGVPVTVHAFSVDKMLRAVELGADRFVHVPTLNTMNGREARIVRDAAIPVSTTVGAHTPFFDEAGVARAFGGTREYPTDFAEQLRRSLMNVRTLWDEGVTVAFGTDSPPMLPVDETIQHEADTLSEVLTNEEIITALTVNAASYLELGDEIGTLEVGKLADIVIIDGDPLADISHLANVKVVIQGGRIVVDKR